MNLLFQLLSPLRRVSASALLAAVTLLVVAGYHPAAQALPRDCDETGGFGLYTFDYGVSLAVSTDLNPGDTIPGTVKSFRFTGLCARNPGGGTWPTIPTPYYFVGCVGANSNAIEVMPGVFSTSSPGIGFRMRNKSGQVIVGGGANCSSSGGTIFGGYTGPAPGAESTHTAYVIEGTMELVRVPGTIQENSVFDNRVKVDPITSAMLPNRYITFYIKNYLDSFPFNPIGAERIFPTGSVTLRTVTCNPTVPASVALPSVALSDLATVGATSPSTSFNLGLNCDGNVIAGVTFDSTMIGDAANGTLTVESTENPVVIQDGLRFQLLLDDNITPLPLGVSRNLGNVTAGTQYTYPFNVRYLRQAGTVGVGNVAATATVTFDYK